MGEIGFTRSLARPTAKGIAVRAAGMALSLGVAIFLARRLAAEDLGAYQGVLSICIILAGLAAATSERLAARRIAALDGADPAELPREVALAHLVAGIAMAVIVVAVLASSFLPAIPESARVTMRLVVLAAPGIAVLSLRHWITLPLQGVAAALGPEQLGQPIVFLAVAGLVSYKSGLDPFKALLIYALVCWAIWLVSTWRSGLLTLLRVGLRDVPTTATLRSRFQEGRPFVLLAAVGVLPVYATVPLVAAFLDLADAGRLAIAMQLTGLVVVPLQIVSLAILPRCTTLHRDGETRLLDALVRSASTISLALGLALATVLLVGLDTILGALGPSFAATKNLIPILVVGQLVNAALGPNGPTMQMIGLEREAAWVETVATVFRLVAVAFAASTGSIVGVAFSITVTTTLRNMLLSTALYRRAGILTLPQLRRRRVQP